jgi:hypothetical protein
MHIASQSSTPLQSAAEQHYRIIKKHLSMAQRCNEEAARFHQAGHVRDALQESALMGIFLQNALHYANQNCASSPTDEKI